MTSRDAAGAPPREARSWMRARTPGEGRGDLEHLAVVERHAQRVRHPVDGVAGVPGHDADAAPVTVDAEAAPAPLDLLVLGLQHGRCAPGHPLHAPVLAL